MSNYVESRYILVLSDEQLVPTICAQRLLKYGYQMVQANHLQDLKLIPEGKRAEALCVVEVSEESRLEHYHQILTQVKKWNKDIPVVFTFHAGVDIVSLELTKEFTPVDIISVPFETEVLLSRIFELAPIQISRNRLNLDAVVQIHLEPILHLDELPFDVFVFLPLNNKAILYKKAGQAQPQEGAFKDLQEKKKKRPLYIRRTDFPIYSKFLSEYVTLQNEEDLDPALRQELMQERFTNVVRTFLRRSEGLKAEEAQSLLDSVRKIAIDYVKTATNNDERIEKIFALAGNVLTNYTHASNVSAYCIMFGSMIGLKDIESLCIGGLFHDLGMAQQRPELTSKVIEDVAQEDLQEYLQHGAGSCEILQKRNVVVNQEIKDILLHHHYYAQNEYDDGVSAYAKICAFADVFDYMTSIRPSRATSTPLDAIKKIVGFGYPEPHMLYDPITHEAILKYVVDEDFVGLAVPEENSGEEAKNASASEQSQSGQDGDLIQSLMKALED